MDSKRLPLFFLLFALAACTPDGTEVKTHGDLGYGNNQEVSYWHPTRVNADNTPNILKAQQMLEADLVACGYETRDHNRWARQNDPVSTPGGHVVDEKGTAREETPLPTTYMVKDCMESRGWVRLKHYYTTPY